MRKLKEGHGREHFSPYPEGKKRLELAKECVEKNLSVREVEAKGQKQETQKKDGRKALSKQFTSIFKDFRKQEKWEKVLVPR